MCTGYPAEWWYSDELADQAEAVTVCSSCPVRETCARAALERGEPYGVWGGLTVRARERIAREEGYPRPGAARHGTRSCYVAGCRCVDCTRANAAYEHQRRVGKLGPRVEASAKEAPYELAPPTSLPLPATAGARFLVDVEAAELGLEDTCRSDETANELGRMVCRADAAGMSEADLRETLTAVGLSLRQAPALLTAARAAYGTLPAHGRRRVRQNAGSGCPRAV